MIPRRELTELLQSRLTTYMPTEKVDELISAILGLEADWEELDVAHRDMGYSMSVNCPDICWLADQVDRGAVFKLYRKKKAPAAQ
jgi:hypothetical protein